MIASDTFQTSLWMSTAVSPPRTKMLTANLKTQVAIIGAGFTGLSAALHLRELGYDVVVLEAKEIGFGASGRNGGQVNPGLKIAPDQLAKKFGTEKALQIFKVTEKSADFVFDLVKVFCISSKLDEESTKIRISEFKLDRSLFFFPFIPIIIFKRDILHFIIIWFPCRVS